MWGMIDYLKHDTADAPEVHLARVVAVGEETFGRSIPASRDVLCVWVLGEYTFAATEVSELYLLAEEENVLWLYVAVEDTLLMHVIDCFKKLVHVVLHLRRGLVRRRRRVVEEGEGLLSRWRDTASCLGWPRRGSSP